jgi:SMODS and SLOG-associating 2TM effector domain 1/SMODS and SLOG-associating 2TM effector domain 3
VLLTVAAVMGALDKPWTAWIGAGAFLCAIVVGSLAVTRGLEKTWYDGRALAESAKSLTWLFAVRGGSFAVGDEESKSILESRLHELRDELRGLAYMPPDEGIEIAPAVRALRECSVEHRRSVYDRCRLQDQIGYYRRRGSSHSRQARRFRVAMIVAQGVGLAGAVLRALDVIHVDLLGIGAAAAASCTAWVQARDHVIAARAYELTAEDLRRVRQDAPTSGDEDSWSSFVAGAEAAMSREHVMWIARRGRVHGH